MSSINNARTVGMSSGPVRDPSPVSTSSSSSLGKSSRIPRFAEATTVHSPTETRIGTLSEKSQVPQSQPGDVGFGYINSDANRESVAVPMTPRSPLKSAMRVPGTPARTINANPLSPTFQEEMLLEDREALTEKEQARDLKVKVRVRLAKFALRGVNFSCSLIVVSMVTSSFAIFDATKSLPAMNGLPAWAGNVNAWPQKVVLGCSCFSLVICVAVFVGYCRGGHKRAEKVGVYYTLFAIGWFILDMIMWAAAAGILQFTKNNSGNQDIWGWACVQNHRSELFSQKVDYALVCRLQNWSLICMIIEIVIEILSIMLYSVIFYRYWSKRKLYKSMNMRDKARSDLYLAQLRTQSAPNTPGFGPKSPSWSTYALSPRFPPNTYKSLSDVDEREESPFTPGGQRLVIPESPFASANPPSATVSQKPFRLQAPPTKANPATPASPKVGFSAASPTSSFSMSRQPQQQQQQQQQPQRTETFNEHAPMVEGEQQYEAVPIPGSYAGAAIRSPPPIKTTFNGLH